MDPIQPHIARLERWLATATRVPKSEHDNLRTTNPVIAVITNPREMQTSYALCAGGGHWRPDARFRGQKQESLREILVEGFRCKIAIFVPPLCGPIYLGLCALRDADVHGYLA